MTLKEKLKDWRSWDGAEFELGVVLGLWPDGEASWLANKATIWMAGPLDDAITFFLQSLVEAGILEYREEPDQAYRWKA